MLKHKGPLTAVSIFLAIFLLVVASYISTTFNTNQDERITVGSRAAESQTCSYNSGQPLLLGQTETDPNNAENRVPISKEKYLYDTLEDVSGFTKVNDEEILTLSKSDGGPVDNGVKNMMSSMFGYKPNKLIAAYDPPRELAGAYVLQVPIEPNAEVKMPNTGYDIGGGYGAMVVFAAPDRVTLHIGIHEYFTGTKKCANGETCSGGYWIYVKGICVDQQILNSYNSVKAAQESAGANLNPIQLPMIRPSHILGKANGNSVLVGVRDNGQFISIFKPDYWGGVAVVNFNQRTAGGTVAITPINTQTPTVILPPTTTTNVNNLITPQPTAVPQPAQELYKVNIPFISLQSGSNNQPTPSPMPTAVFTSTRIVYFPPNCTLVTNANNKLTITCPAN